MIYNVNIKLDTVISSLIIYSMEQTDTKLYNFRMDPAMMDRMKELARRDRRSLTKEVVVAIEQFLDEQEAAA